MAAALALLLMVTGPVVLANPRWQDSPARPSGPLGLAFGLGLFAYALFSGLSFRRRRKRRVEIPARWTRMISWILLVLAALCLFWSAALYAQDLGAGAAQTLVDQRFARKPDVIVYSTSRINVDPHDVIEDDLGPAYAPYRYRYSGFKLLVHANKRLLLIPFDWSKSNAFAIVLPEDGTRLVFAPYFSTSQPVGVSDGVADVDGLTGVRDGEGPGLLDDRADDGSDEGWPVGAPCGKADAFGAKPRTS
ncbi:hypothetical protein ACQP2F_19365 [Actinoplanes sp. CA-030573]|uniref:hypothetical protein n=1 Tax=Actinoplanes sp. CA-030573 TaxID=3239898 RepID=UPI003D8D66D1